MIRHTSQAVAEIVTALVSRQRKYSETGVTLDRPHAARGRRE